MQPPEFFKQSEISSSADIWSFGLLLYQLYDQQAFVLPDDNDDAFKEMEKRAKAGELKPKALSSLCPLEIQILCQQCFEQDHTKRATAAQLLEVVGKWLST